MANEIEKIDFAVGSITITPRDGAPCQIGVDDFLAGYLDGVQQKVVADNNVIGGIPVVHRIDITAGDEGDTDVTLTYKTRVLDVWLILGAAGVGSSTLQVSNGTDAITDAMDSSGSDEDLVRAAVIAEVYHEIAAGGTLRVTGASGDAGQQGKATVYVQGVRVA